MVIELIKYPNNIQKKHEKIIKYNNRGMTLEYEINLSNEYYLSKNIAVIYKKPTPIQVVEQKNEKITKAFFKEPSTTDYNGVYKGKYIDFEAKETKSKTSFPINNIHKHQIKHLENILNQQGIGFLIIRFTTLNKTYLLPAEYLLSFLNENTRKSIPLAFFEKNAIIIKENLSPRLDYLEVIDKLGGKLCQKEEKGN